MLKVTLCPAFSVTGAVKPLVENPVPVQDMFEIVMLDPPELVITSDLVWVLPTCTDPKETLEGFAARLPAVTPDPESGMLSAAFDALLAREMLPVAFPALVGVKVAVKLALCPD